MLHSRRKSVQSAAILAIALSLGNIAACGDPSTDLPADARSFDVGQDLFLPQFDSKTDVDDLHSVAGVATVLSDPAHAGLNYRAVAGAYGIQGGLYVPAEELFTLAFGENWTDAHADRDQSLDEIEALVLETLAAGGHVWVAEAGQSDFTADWLQRINQADSSIDTKARVHVVQHSEWNESVTSPDKLAYVRENADYVKIDDGNASGNGTPNFNSQSAHSWEAAIANSRTGDAWQMAREVGNRFNGVDNRYLNENIAAGGIDFSDTVETCWILGCEGVSDPDTFFVRFAAETTAEWVPLFNGRDLTGWTPKFSGSPVGTNYKNTFRVEDGLLKVSYDQYPAFDGEFGHLFTDDVYSHYEIRATYRFVGSQAPGGPDWAFRNNGLMLHSQDPATMDIEQDFPASVEVQLLGSTETVKRSNLNLCTPESDVVMNDNLATQHCINSELPATIGDEWVTVEVEVLGGQRVNHKMDGKTVMTYERPQLSDSDNETLVTFYGGTAMTHGHIAIQAETHPIEFKSIEVRRLR